MDTIQQDLQIPAAGVVLEGVIARPSAGAGLVLFAHGSGSSRHSPRNRHVAEHLQAAGLATVLVDLLTPEEEQVDARTGELRFNIALLSVRLAALSDWLSRQERLADLGIGLFGGQHRRRRCARGRGGPDHNRTSRRLPWRAAGPREFLSIVYQPTLLIVGERDRQVIELNRTAMQLLAGETRLDIVPGATHLFEEPGALAEVATQARDWFVDHLTTVPAPKRQRTGR